MVQPSSSPHADLLPSWMMCHALRLRPGEELKGALEAFTSAKKIKAGFIMSCVGSVRDVSLRLAGAERPTAAALAFQADRLTAPSSAEQRELLPQKQDEQPMLHTDPEERFEICSLTGTLSRTGLHLHASLGDERGGVCGGHLVRATVHTTAEIVIGVATGLTFSREMDPSTGFKELVVGGTHVMVQKLFFYFFVFYVLAMVVGVGVFVWGFQHDRW